MSLDCGTLRTNERILLSINSSLCPLPSGPNMETYSCMKTLLPSLVNLIYPPVCETCGNDLPDDHGGLCWDCLRAIELLCEPFCQRCGMPVSGAVDLKYNCQRCSTTEPHFDRARAAARFEGPMRNAVHAFKYHAAFWLEQPITDFLVACAEAHFSDENFDVIAPVPLFIRRQRERGFNQSELLVRSLSARLGTPWARPLTRIRPTPSQTRLSIAQRRENVRNAFEACNPAEISKKSVLLIDDVMTSGATVNECSRTLKRAGARRVVVVTAARG